jgi:hypothetical protein
MLAWPLVRTAGTVISDQRIGTTFSIDCRTPGESKTGQRISICPGSKRRISNRLGTMTTVEAMAHPRTAPPSARVPTAIARECRSVRGLTVTSTRTELEGCRVASGARQDAVGDGVGSGAAGDGENIHVGQRESIERRIAILPDHNVA